MVKPDFDPLVIADLQLGDIQSSIHTLSRMTVGANALHRKQLKSKQTVDPFRS
jgi:hypothetical protein